MSKVKPKVLIVGAGLSGITLVLLLERAGVNYEVFERATVVKPFGSAISLGSNVLFMSKQLNLLDEIQRIGKPFPFTDICDENRVVQNHVDMSFRGISPLRRVSTKAVRPAPALHPSAQDPFPEEGSVQEQDADGVAISTADNMKHSGDILVGADGAYSSVRQNMYKQLKLRGKLPKSDDGELPFSFVCLVGQTDTIDPKERPELDKVECCCQCVSKDNDAFRNSEWGPEAAEQMCKEVRDFPIPGGNNRWIMGDLIDRTPKDLISKVTLEE
ncbi:hypothetical protein BGZ74_008726 [Mortierella antarctica]|nr:hypothetical protein BGZ74_008726 [Mortierella antarctica]